MKVFKHTEELEKPHKRRTWSIRFSMINRSAASKTEAQPGSTVSPRMRNGGERSMSDETASLFDDAKWRRLKPFLGHQMPKIFYNYKPLKIIGKGQYGTVFEVEERLHPAQLTNDKAINETSDQKKPRVYACKVIDILPHGASIDNRDDDRSRLEDIKNEIDILAGPGGGHPNVQDLVDFAVEDDKSYIVSSLCQGGDLAQALEMRGCLCEEDARNIMAGIPSGLAHLHSREIVHRDVKLENVLLTDCKHDMSKVKIIDMGFAKRLACPHATRYAETDNDICGTPMYIAPELIRSMLQRREPRDTARHGTQADMWSCGVILYCLLSGYPPFEARDDGSDMADLFENIVKSDYDFYDPIWETVSGEALSMVTCLLEADPAKRLTAEEALRHPWMIGR